MRTRLAFRQDRWDARHRLACARAFREVPFYREQWASAGRELPEPLPVTAGELQQELFRLCPLRSQWDPRREPTLWTGESGALADALTLADPDQRRMPVLEVREAAVDWTQIGNHRAPYAFLLRPDADVGGDGRRLALQLAALKLAVDHGRVIVVGSSAELAELLPELDRALAPVVVGWSPVHRVTLMQAASTSDAGVPAVLHDPFLGYIAARVRDCGEFHLLWDRVHAKLSPSGLLFTRLRGRRPMLVNVIPVESGFSEVRCCPSHRTPVLVP
jgi:hypothetical protein